MQKVYVYYDGYGTSEYLTAKDDYTAEKLVRDGEPEMKISPKKTGSIFTTPFMITANRAYWLPAHRLAGVLITDFNSQS